MKKCPPVRAGKVVEILVSVSSAFSKNSISQKNGKRKNYNLKARFEMSEQEKRAATAVEKTEYKVPEEGIYCMEIEDISEVRSKYPNKAGDFEFRYEFKSQIWKPDGDAIELFFWSSKKFSFGSYASDLARWVSGAIGVDEAIALDSFEPSDWIGKPLQVKVFHKEVTGEDGVTITGVKPKVKTWMSPTKAHKEQAVEAAKEEEIEF